jgi:gold/copper resistance efflux pump
MRSNSARLSCVAVKGGALTRLRDVAKIEMGSSSYSLRSLLDGKPAVAIQIIQSPGANALEVASAVRGEMAKLEQNFPEDIAYRIAYDSAGSRAGVEARPRLNGA